MSCSVNNTKSAQETAWLSRSTETNPPKLKSSSHRCKVTTGFKFDLKWFIYSFISIAAKFAITLLSTWIPPVKFEGSRTFIG